MFFPKINIKNDPVRRWHRPDRHFFANGACQVLAYAFLERYPELGFHARWIKPADGFTGNHIFVTDGTNGRRFFPGWDATLVDLPADVLVSEQRSRQIEGLWLREPKQFLHDALPRARNFLDRFGDIKCRCRALTSPPR